MLLNSLKLWQQAHNQEIASEGARTCSRGPSMSLPSLQRNTPALTHPIPPLHSSPRLGLCCHSISISYPNLLIIIITWLVPHHNVNQSEESLISSLSLSFASSPLPITTSYLSPLSHPLLLPSTSWV